QNNTTFIKPELDHLTQELALLEEKQVEQERTVEKTKQDLEVKIRNEETDKSLRFLLPTIKGTR
ncbi:hypothetical protein LGW37_08185, partial [Streptococcus mutans]|nr:hypothetical protein [Streptococcus mutans]